MNLSKISKVLLAPTRKPVGAIGAFMVFLGEVTHQAFVPPVRWRALFQQLEFVGNQSLNIILLTGFFTGAVFGLQIGGIFLIFRSESMMGGATALALTRELAPLVTGFLLAGRAGSAMAAELATMRVNEQIDAVEAMAVDPIHLLVVPRVLASVIMMPLLCGIFMFVGVLGAYAVGIAIYVIDEGIFLDKLLFLVQSEDITSGLKKMVVFGFLISAISCRFGLYAAGGARGVGEATTKAVVWALVGILFTDFVMSYVQIKWFT